MESPPSPHSSAVSGLMQQLKSGEISKMQLFQQIAKLQAANASATANAQTPAAAASAKGYSSAQPMPPAFSMTSTMPAAPVYSSQNAGLAATLGSRAVPGPQVSYQQPAAQQQYVSFTLSAPVAPVTTQYPAQQPQYSFLKPNGVPSASSSGSHRASGAPIVESNAEFLASGVSHDKAPRFSVQEWMATKNRNNNSSSTAGEANSMPAAASLYQQPPVQSFLPNQYHQYERQNEELRYANSITVPRTIDHGNVPSLFSFSQPQERSQYDDDSDPNGIASQIRMLNLPSSQQHEPSHIHDERDDDRYEYNPQRQLSHHSSSSSNHQYDQQQYDDPNRDASSNEQKFIDFTEHFRDDLDDRGPTDNDGPGNTKGNANNNNNNSTKNNNASTSLGDDAFHTRVTRWKSQKDAVREQMKQQLLQSELDECTFAPKVNPKSTKVAAKLRSRGGQSLTGTGGDTSSSPFAVSERLYQEADNYKAREELAQRVKAEEEADLERECTFKPKINRTSSLTDKVKAKYMDIAPRNHPSPSLTAAAMESTAKELEQCTFYPKVNPISAEMVSAQLYLQQDIYERLSRPCCMAGDSPVKSQRQRGGRVRRAGSLTDDDMSRDTDSDLASSMASPRRAQDDFYIRSPSPRRRRSSVMASGRHGHNHNGGSMSTGKQKQQRPRSAGGLHTDEEKDERARRLDNFLERQHFHEEARRKKIETTKQQLLPAHKPTINKKSLDMMENGRKGDFLERITKYALRKEHDDVKKKSVRVSVSVSL